MLFNSLHFIFFFIIVTGIYFNIPHKYRWFLLLSSSCYFYMIFVPIYILILGFTIVIDYFAGIMIENAEGNKRKKYLIFSLIANIGVLAIFKYYNFLNQNLSKVFNIISIDNPFPFLSILLPIGLSFHTFQAMSYTIEVYRGNQKAERTFGIYSLYVMFYPQLVAGPIERPQNLLHQFYEKHEFDYRRVSDGLKLIMWGMFKKIVIADRLAAVVDVVYNNPRANHGGFEIILATIFFAFQIFCDFSGYSDIAIGSAKVMGFKLMKNFDRPYISASIHEFWKRWHISLSTWFKDYFYITLGGNRVSVPRWYLNLFVVFLVSGLWHGANWTFVIWGALHGFYLVFGLITKKTRQHLYDLTGLNNYPNIKAVLQQTITFGLVCFAWIFFRAKTAGDAFYLIKKGALGVITDLHSLVKGSSIQMDIASNKRELIYCFAAIVFLEIIHRLQNKYSILEWINSRPTYFRWGLYYIVIFVILFMGVYQGENQFIYFQF